MRTSEKTETLCKKHLARILTKSKGSDLLKKLRDPHLILYLSSYVETDDLYQLGKFVGQFCCSDNAEVENSQKIPGKLSMTLDMLGMSFSSSGQSNDDIDD